MQQCSRLLTWQLLKVHTIGLKEVLRHKVFCSLTCEAKSQRVGVGTETH